MFNNETRLYDFDQEDFDSQWLEDDDGLLYIVGGPGRGDIIGPDNEITDVVCAVLCTNGTNELTDTQIELLGLSEIPDVLKRFSPMDGYYHA